MSGQYLSILVEDASSGAFGRLTSEKTCEPCYPEAHVGLHAEKRKGIMLKFSKGQAVLFCAMISVLVSNGCGSKESSQLQSEAATPLPSYGVSHRALESSGELALYDTCRDTWIPTGLPFREEPTYTQERVVRPSKGIDREYIVQGKRSRLFEVDIYHLEDHMQVGGQHLPKSLRGIWWMDGNPVPEVVLSFADARYSPEERTLVNPFNGPNGYLVSGSFLGRLWHEITNALNAKILLAFPPETNIDSPKAGDKIYVDPLLKDGFALQANWPTTYVNDTHWRRDTQGFCYNLRQIVDERGRKLPAYDYFVQQVRKQNIAMFGRNPDVLLAVRCIEEACADVFEGREAD